MRIAIYVAAVLAVAAVAPETIRAVAACAVSVLFEVVPYLVLGRIVKRVGGRSASWALALGGCGCASGAVSIPALVAGWAIFGPWVALGRWFAALALTLGMRRGSGDSAHPDDTSILSDLVALAPAAALCGIVTAWLPNIALGHRPLLAQLLCGAFIGVVASPCALGGIALASSFHTSAPVVSGAILATSGIVRAPFAHLHVREDSLAYALLALACAAVALERGASLVHPRMTIPLAISSLFIATRAWHARSQSSR